MTSTKSSLNSVSLRAANLWRKTLRRLYMSTSEEQEVVTRFAEAYAAARPPALWMGEPVTTPPLDLWIYQEILHETGCDLVLAVDTANAGFLADICQMHGSGEVLSIQTGLVTPTGGTERPRLRMLQGPPVDAGTVAAAAEVVAEDSNVLVVLGSGLDPLAEALPLYAPLVSIGSYLIVEDTHPPAPTPANGHGLDGRAQAVASFLRSGPVSPAPGGRSGPGFEVDPAREKLYLTYNPGGYLIRVR